MGLASVPGHMSEDGEYGRPRPLGSVAVAVGVLALLALASTSLVQPVCGCSKAPPPAEFEYDATASPSLQAVWERSDQVQASALGAEVRGGEGTVRLRESGTVTEGDQLVASASGLDPGDRVVLLYREGNDTEELAEYTVPE